MHILEIANQQDLRKVFQGLKVDPYGIKIMTPKASNYVLKLNSISSIAANILKQEMLSLGGDVAVPWDLLKRRMKKTDCVLMGSLAQLTRLKEKLKIQPFGLHKLADNLAHTLANYQKDDFILDLGKYKLNLTPKPRIMGVLNLTPDSFSGNGLYQESSTRPDPGVALDTVNKMVSAGADIIDLGGESSRPGARAVPLEEELSRTLPVIKLLAKKINLPISIDTSKPEVARQALDNGAVILNDIRGLRDAAMRKVAAKYKAAVVIMHMKGNPRTMQVNPTYKSLIDEMMQYLDNAIVKAEEAGIAKEKTIIDPGIGFGKTLGHNLEILKRLREFKSLGRPILVGPSRKSFIGRILKAGPKDRIFGTVSACVLAAENGAHILRVHDIKQVAEALKVSGAILSS